MKNIGIVLLAAGSSSRLGRPKQLLPVEGSSLIRRSCESALESGCRPCVAVLGCRYERVRDEIIDLPVEIVVNSNWEDGIGSSLKVGIEYLNRCDAEPEACIVMLCDQPFVNADLLKDLATEYRDGKNRIVATQYRETVGVPALFHRELWPEMMRLKPECGAKALILRHGNEIATVAFVGAEIDIDTPADWEALAETWNRTATAVD